MNGDLIIFEDRPEFEEVYLAGASRECFSKQTPPASRSPPTSGSSENILTDWDYTFLHVATSFSELARVKSLKLEGVHKIPDAMLSPHGQQVGAYLYQQ